MSARNWSPTEAAECRPGCKACTSLRSAIPGVVSGVGIESVTREDLAEAVGLPASLACRHEHLAALIQQEYQACASTLQADLFGGIVEARSWEEGLRRGLNRAFASVLADADRARFCFEQVLRGDAELLRVRETVRRRSVALWQYHYSHMSGTGGTAAQSILRFEYIHGAVLHHVSTCVQDQALTDLPDRVDAIVALAA